MGCSLVLKDGKKDEVILEQNIDAVVFTIDSDNQAKARDIPGYMISVTGRITGPEDGSDKIAEWSVAADIKKTEEIYKHLIMEVYQSEELVRKYNFTSAFVLDYRESFAAAKDGEGIFELILKQKADKNGEVKVKEESKG